MLSDNESVNGDEDQIDIPMRKKSTSQSKYSSRKNFQKARSNDQNLDDSMISAGFRVNEESDEGYSSTAGFYEANKKKPLGSMNFAEIK